jgi:hypothetical protein
MERGKSELRHNVRTCRPSSIRSYREGSAEAATRSAATSQTQQTVPKRLILALVHLYSRRWESPYNLSAFLDKLHSAKGQKRVLLAWVVSFGQTPAQPVSTCRGSSGIQLRFRTHVTLTITMYNALVLENRWGQWQIRSFWRRFIFGFLGFLKYKYNIYNFWDRFRNSVPLFVSWGTPKGRVLYRNRLGLFGGRTGRNTT